MTYPATASDWRTLAQRRLPRFLFDYVDGGAGDERTPAANEAAFASLALRQRVLVDVSQVDTRSRIAVQDCALPLALAPGGAGGHAGAPRRLRACPSRCPPSASAR